MGKLATVICLIACFSLYAMEHIIDIPVDVVKQKRDFLAQVLTAVNKTLSDQYGLAENNGIYKEECPGRKYRLVSPNELKGILQTFLVRQRCCGTLLLSGMTAGSGSCSVYSWLCRGVISSSVGCCVLSMIWGGCLYIECTAQGQWVDEVVAVYLDICPAHGGESFV